MDRDGKFKSHLGNDKDLRNCERDRITGTRSSDLRKRDKPAMSLPNGDGIRPAQQQASESPAK